MSQKLQLSNYDIFIGDIWEPLQRLVQAGNYSKIAVLVDENTRRLCLPVFLQNIDVEPLVIEIPAGELHKNLDTCRHVWQEMMRLELDRSSLLVNLGGGVIGDLGGFCAATFLRGIDFVQMPTTLLSQVDASIGGKLGIDFNWVKNNIGVFHDPKAVFIEPAFLKTLPEREIRSGFAEIIKHALIADVVLWENLQTINGLRTVDWAVYLAPSLAIKQRIVEKDPFEKGIRKALNFGHTIGHAVESLSLQTDQPLLHGEAIAVGILCESWLSHKTAGLPTAELENIVAFVRRFFSPFSLKIKDFPQLFDLMKKDKKNKDGNINFTLISPLGNALTDCFCEEKLIEESLLI